MATAGSMMSATSPAMMMRSQEDEKKYKKALRFIYKYGQESANKLTEEAIEACKRQNISTEELLCKTVEEFAIQKNSHHSHANSYMQGKFSPHSINQS